MGKKSKYHRKITMDEDGYSDVYDVLKAFGITCPAQAHAIKKMLAPGQRSGGKSRKQDIEEAIWSLNRSLELEEVADSGVYSSANVSE